MAPQRNPEPGPDSIRQSEPGRQPAGRTARGPERRHGVVSLLLAGAVLAAPPLFAQDEAAFAPLEPKLDALYRDLPGPIHYFATQVDLNGDAHPEFVVHVAGPMVCGSGGCDTLIFAERDEGPTLVASITVTRPPIVVARTKTNGWRDLIVHVSGGGILPGHDARLRFDGTTYPQNPTVEPAEALAEEPQGTVVITEFESFREGRLLRAASE